MTGPARRAALRPGRPDPVCPGIMQPLPAACSGWRDYPPDKSVNRSKTDRRFSRADTAADRLEMPGWTAQPRSPGTVVRTCGVWLLHAAGTPGSACILAQPGCAARAARHGSTSRALPLLSEDISVQRDGGGPIAGGKPETATGVAVMPAAGLARIARCRPHRPGHRAGDRR